MAEFPAGQERLLKKLISARRCRVCRQTFDRNHVRLAAKDQELWIISARCTSCRHQQLFWVTMRSANAGSLLKDVSDEEEELFGAMDPVGTDDVLDMHLFLQIFDGDFQKLFEV
ncbi:MAG: hypothetical protein ACR2JC_18320 [Chloroflexota bacterium]|nr:MAG: hypothetical protein DLM70_05750 [Chloroflexota bacterium]